ncbi:MAG: hypothetical protein K9H61_09915 [Bacteroidia bacterium]|nr:hypothetical protein [Bacteroidia bacterium]MCF8428368.1 hypothetical protein [Bacteroidia bacterium]MCF8447297.1 hypothetical protein [Bacteroidia bacterium]
MKADSSKLAYNKFETLSNKNVRFYLIDGTIYTGSLIGFFKGLEDEGEPYIIQWHLVNTKDYYCAAMDSQEFFDGILIHHSQIKWIQFKQDQSIIDFNILLEA